MSELNPERLRYFHDVIMHAQQDGATSVTIHGAEMEELRQILSTVYNYASEGPPQSEAAPQPRWEPVTDDEARWDGAVCRTERLQIGVRFLYADAVYRADDSGELRLEARYNPRQVDC